MVGFITLSPDRLDILQKKKKKTNQKNQVLSYKHFSTQPLKTMCRKSFFGIICAVVTFLLSVVKSNRDEFYRSCHSLTDGTYNLTLFDDGPSAILVKCWNEHIILDFSTDDSVSSYFSTWSKVPGRGFGCPESFGEDENSLLNWQEWFLPNENIQNKYSYSTSLDCHRCDVMHHDTTFYIQNSGGFRFEMVVDTPNVNVSNQGKGILLPAIGTNGKNCVCVKENIATVQ